MLRYIRESSPERRKHGALYKAFCLAASDGKNLKRESRRTFFLLKAGVDLSFNNLGTLRLLSVHGAFFPCPTRPVATDRLISHAASSVTIIFSNVIIVFKVGAGRGAELASRIGHRRATSHAQVKRGLRQQDADG